MYLFLILLVSIFSTINCQDDIPLPSMDELNPNRISSLFASYMKEFGKEYDDLSEQERAKFNFEKSVRDIIELNEKYKDQSMEFGLNQYSDLSDQEFSDQLLNLDCRNKSLSDYLDINSIDPHNFAPLPASFDWRSRSNTVGPVRDQGRCGCCWAFAATAVTQSVYAIRNNVLIQPSEAQLCDCGMKNRAGCNGGSIYGAFRYIKNNGISRESDYPKYTDQRAMTYRSCEDRNKPNNIKLTSYTLLDPSNALAIQQMLVAKGPIAVGFAVGMSYRNYRSGIFSMSDCNDPRRLLGFHAVTVVGYGTENGVPYWLIKNSWGSRWGMSGYQKFYRGSDLCGLETSEVVYAT